MGGSTLWTLARRLRPALARLEGQPRAHALMEMIPVLFTGPFALVALVWLVAATDPGAVRAHALLLALVTGALAIMQRHSFTIQVELRSGDIVPITGSLGGIVTWSAALIAGPTALWTAVLVHAVSSARLAWQQRRLGRQPVWLLASLFSQEMGGETLGSLAGLAVYTALGGEYPLAGLAAGRWLPALAASIVAALIPPAVLLPVMAHINRLSLSTGQPGGLLSWWRAIIAFALITTGPFAILGALIHSEGSAALYALFVAGIVLVNFLAYHLSRANERSQQRARELARLEALGEALIQAPPDLSTLEETLVAYIGGMFPQDRVEVRLFGPQEAAPGLHWPALRLTFPPGRPPVADAAWERLQQSPDLSLVLHDAIPPGMNTVYGDALLVKIAADEPGQEGGAKERFLGGIALLRHASVGRVTASLPAVQALASQIGSAFYRARVYRETLATQRMAQELEIAGRIQARFLPRSVPQVAGWDITAGLVPARQTSGDFYDFVALPDGQLGVVVADVADKGTGAALYMALSRTLIRTFALQHAPAEALRAANARILTDAESDQFVTVFYGVLGAQSGLITFASAGHTPGYVLRAEGAVERLIRTGVPLGMFEGATWAQRTAQLETGDVLVLYTDGVTEAHNPAGQEFGEDRMLTVAAANRGRPAADIYAAIVGAVSAFAGGAPQHDDITLVIAARTR